MLTVQKVSRRFADGTVALEDVDLTIADGAFVVLLGPSGCGKSTLLRLLAGLDQPDAGRILWDEGAKPRPGEIGFVFQDATLLPWADATENVFLPLRLAGRSLSDSRAEITDLLARLGLTGFEHAKPSELSGGMRMRVSIARAMIGRPRLLLMDEPFAALDEFTRHRLQNDLRTLWHETNMTVVFVTHSIYEAAFLASQIVIMTPRPGQIATIRPGIEQTAASRRTDPAMIALVGAISADVARMMPTS
jgi:NitT/TauT family transport system ATP-binding protein